MNKDYKIIRMSPYREMVILLTYDVTDDILSMIESAVFQKSGNTIFYFDFLVSNGLSNRFFQASVSSLKRHGKLKPCQVIPRKYEQLSDDFFRKHYSYVEYSVLSRRQKDFFR